MLNILVVVAAGKC